MSFQLPPSHACAVSFVRMSSTSEGRKPGPGPPMQIADRASLSMRSAKLIWTNVCEKGVSSYSGKASMS